MRAVVTRVASAEVRVNGNVVGSIGRGLLVLAGVEKDDTPVDAGFVASKVKGLRVFEDSEGKMNLSVEDVGGGVLAVSQFTLLGDCRKGRRPSFVQAGEPGSAKELFEELVRRLQESGLTVETGEFGAHMEVESVNDGPVTLLLDSRKVF
jgi:D-tyrosyl-tRNA(Tyr) deacylase